MNGLDSAIHGLEQVLHEAQRQQTWRGMVRQRIAGVQQALSSDSTRADDPWQAAREGHLHRERKHLVDRINRLRAAEEGNVEAFRQEVHRLLHDLEHHRQRVHDLVYDSVAMDIGGSE